MDLSKPLQNYIETTIIPLYKTLDSSHSPAHIEQVIANSFEIVASLPKSLAIQADIVYTVAAYHDIGLLKNRQNHEVHGRSILQNDLFLQKFFTREELLLSGEAVEDHRASSSCAPRSIYGKIISEADRDLDFMRILERTIRYAQEKKQLKDPKELQHEAYNYIHAKYGPNHSLVFWLDYPKNIKEIQTYLKDINQFNQAFFSLYSQLAQ